MGPGALIKVVLGANFSLLVFGFTQVAIDIEPLVRLLNHDPVLHGHSHTYLGAGAISFLCFLLGWPMFRFLVDRWNAIESNPALIITEKVTARTAFIGAAIGGLSHILLDSVMHADMSPLWPWSGSNALLGAISVEALHKFCLLSGLAGFAVMFLRHYLNSVRD